MISVLHLKLKELAEANINQLENRSSKSEQVQEGNITELKF